MSTGRTAEGLGHETSAMPVEKSDPLLAQMRDAVRAGGGKRSKLSLWMVEREGEIAGMIASYGADWEAWATLWVANGLLGAPKGWGADGPAGAAARRRAAETARQTWLRVRRRKRSVQGLAKPRAAAAQADARQTVPGTSDVAVGLVERGEEAAKRRLAALDRELRERSR
jgi:hypothetical protein